MKVLILNGAFAKANEQEAIDCSRGRIEFSAIRFQEKIIGGFKDIGADYESLSAPFIAPWKGHGKMFFRGFKNEQGEHTYVKFCNIWGIRNISRAKALKKKIKGFIKLDDESKLIVITAPHTPFLEAAVYAKSKDPRIKINLIVPDLPEFMNLSARVSKIYKFAKKFDISKFNKLSTQIDSFMLLTEPMKDKLPINDKPYFVSEGIIEDDIIARNKEAKRTLKKDTYLKYIVYTGTTNEKFGIKNLVNAFSLINDSSYRLVICGAGDADSYIKEQALNDKRIMVLGLVPPGVAGEWVLKADALVNPRLNNEEYTKYSFPSKNLEYLSSGNKTICYMLDGMKPIYKRFILAPSDDSPKALATTIQEALQDSENPQYDDFIEYAKALKAPNICKKIIEITM